MRNEKQVYLACCLVHLLLIAAVCTRDTFSLIANGFTSLPVSLQKYGDRGENVTEAMLGQKLPVHHALRQGVILYQNAAGIELGYGYFAPAVPNSCKLVFEIHYPGGRVEYDLPRAADGAGGSRLVRFLDQIGRLEYKPLREMMLKMLGHTMLGRNIPPPAAFGLSLDLSSSRPQRKCGAAKMKLIGLCMPTISVSGKGRRNNKADESCS